MEEAVQGSARLGNYLRRLREGYGYTLRRVEERTSAIGEPIDNSQLSRFEKGKAFPSFDKLRVLARVFNVSVQNFSDIIDLEQFETLRPEAAPFDVLVVAGWEAYDHGEYGRAYVTFEQAYESVFVESNGSAKESAAEARLLMSISLKKLGKLAMAESELRVLLRERRSIGRRVRVRALLQLALVQREQGDLYVGSVTARECLALASEEGDLDTQASVLNMLANVHHDENEYEDAATYYERAIRIVEQLGGRDEMRATILINLGGCRAALSRVDAGTKLIREALDIARTRKYRRTEALALTRLAEISIERGDLKRARMYLVESDLAAKAGKEELVDILFLNTFRTWEMARKEANAVRERLALGRLKHYRSFLERRFPEVDKFDAYIGKVQS
jgi:transcriptional regulator with XRE-family HTH domain/Tfp pilus assembly protein PilF